MRSANNTTNQRELIPDNIAVASAIPARSAAMLIVFAVSSAMTKASKSHFGNRCLKFPARPCPVTLPIRAHIICTAAISGHVSSAVQRSLVPSWAPATEYVAMPDGSSSAAPVITPGPSDFNSNCIHREGANVKPKTPYEITRRIYSESSCANRALKVVQCAQTRVFGTYTMRCSEEMRWPLQRSVQLHLTSEVQQWKPY